MIRYQGTVNGIVTIHQDTVDLNTAYVCAVMGEREIYFEESDDTDEMGCLFVLHGMVARCGCVVATQEYIDDNGTTGYAYDERCNEHDN